jgi:prevent-host-death family protein
MTALAIATVRKNFAEAIDAARHGERIALTKNGRAVAALVPIEDMRFMEEKEDRSLVRAAKKAVKESRGRYLYVEDIRKLK